jgi:hypothetical protein
MKLNEPAMTKIKNTMTELKPTAVTVINAVLTLKQYAAIHLCVPDSGDSDLDAMIRRAQRERLAGQITASLSTGCTGLLGGEFTAYANGSCNSVLVERAIVLADALIAAEGVK